MHTGGVCLGAAAVNQQTQVLIHVLGEERDERRLQSESNRNVQDSGRLKRYLRDKNKLTD